MQKSTRRFDRRKALILAALTGALVLGLAACYPGGPENLGDIGVVVTLKNPTGNFQNMSTYAMSDEVVSLVDPNDPNQTPINPALNPTILEELNAQMVAAGFTLETDPDNNKPDVWIRVGAVESKVWVYSYSYGWPGYPGWGWYYPPYLGTSSFQQGTLIWDMHDLRDIEDPTDPDTTPVNNWVGALNGALQSSANSTEEGIRSGIRQAFAQSPYIVGTPAGN